MRGQSKGKEGAAGESDREHVEIKAEVMRPNEFDNRETNNHVNSKKRRGTRQSTTKHQQLGGWLRAWAAYGGAAGRSKRDYRVLDWTDNAGTATVQERMQDNIEI